MEINDISQEKIKNEIVLNEKLSAFDKLKKIQMLIKKESSLKEICTK